MDAPQDRGSGSELHPLWWHEEGIAHFVAGVFEGGGAKGVLYAGALAAMVDRPEPCWFRAVAGASAGAITATLIAAGFRPEEVGAETAAALRCLRRPTTLSGLSRVRRGLSYLDQDALTEWLRGLLDGHLRRAFGAEAGGAITFRALFELTGIELDVVAVDLNQQRPVVFNHVLTPRCQVVEAVIASAAIPLAFEWMPLAVPGGRTGIVVDGGVMANFPSFVFRDASFRRWAGLADLTVPVIGFLLDEAAGHHDERDRYLDSEFETRFWRRHERAGRFRVRPTTASPVGRAAAAALRVLRVVTWPAWKLLLVWIPALLRWNSDSFLHGNWPAPRNPTARTLVRWYDSVITGIRPWGVLLGGFTAVTLTLGVGAYHVAWRPLAGHLGDIADGDTSIQGGALGLVILVLWSVVPVYAWMVVSAMFFGASLVHRSVQMTGYGLVKTFLRGPGAPLWAGEAPDDHVVRLAVPPGITTLEIAIDDDALRAALAAAGRATRDELALIVTGGQADP